MHSLWSGKEVEALSELDLLVYQSRLIGSEPSLVVWGGGNTSIKVTQEDFRGQSTKVLLIKSSGVDMKTAQREDFVGVRLDDILPLFDRDAMTDEEMVDYLDHCAMDPRSPRPSIETLLHGFLPYYSVVHSHADALVALTNNTDSNSILDTVYGNKVAVVEYVRPGFRLSKLVGQAVKSNPTIRGVVLANHGLFTWGGDTRAAYECHIDLVNQAEEYAQRQARGKVSFGGLRSRGLDSDARRGAASAIAPALRGLVSERRRSILHYDDSPKVLEFVNSNQGEEISAMGPVTPDHLIHTKRKPMWLRVADPEDVTSVVAALPQAMEEYTQEYVDWYRLDSGGGDAMLDPYPRVVLMPGVGMWTTGKDSRAALIARDIYHHTIDVLRAAQGMGQYASLSPKDAYEAEYWPLELYKLTLGSPEGELARRIALVTGGAAGIGRAVALRLAAEGAHVVVTDVDEEGALAVVEEISSCNGSGRAAALSMDVTSETEVIAAFQQGNLTYGGLDILVSNAGIAPVGAMDELSLAQWQRSLDINATGHFLVAREAVRVMRRQGLGGSLIFMGTKNVTAPGRDFGAYSASKAAEVQLARVLAIENGEHGIRSNIINPDAVFQGSGLWSQEVRQQRAEAHGVSTDDLEDFYRQRNLLKQRISAEDVAEAALFLASDRSAKTTGAMIPVDGGVREAFPR